MTLHQTLGNLIGIWHEPDWDLISDVLALDSRGEEDLLLYHHVDIGFAKNKATKALCALKGLVKLLALVRGHRVRKQATATLCCMQALVTVQAKARAQRIKMVEDTQPTTQRQSVHRRSLRCFRQSYDLRAEWEWLEVGCPVFLLNWNEGNSFINHALICNPIFLHVGNGKRNGRKKHKDCRNEYWRIKGKCN